MEVIQVQSRSNEPNLSDLQLETQDWMAECQSLDPDLSLVFRGPTSAWDCLCLLYLMSHVAGVYWLTEEITRQISQKAYQCDYQGEWEAVQFLLEQSISTPEEFYWKFIEVKSPEEFFGNLVPRAKRLSLGMKCFKRKPSRKPVNYPQRKRGYRDKGTYRPPHEFHGDPPEKDQKLDRRGRVYHPLIREEDLRTEGRICLTNSGGEDNVFRKGRFPGPF